MRTRSITFLLTLYFSIASTAVLLIGGYFVGRLVDEHLAEQDRLVLDGKLELVRSVLAKAGSETDLAAMPGRLSAALVGHHDLFVEVFAPDGTRLYATPGFEVPRHPVESAAPTQPAAAEQTKARDWNEGDHHFRALEATAATGIVGAPLARAIVALDTGFHRAFMAEFRNSLWLGVGVGIALSAVLGWLSARRGLLPARRASQLMQRISAERLAERLPPDSLPSELIPLATAFNDMLARLEESFRRLSDFSSDLAHELRTPISNLMTQTQVALARARTSDEYQEILYSNLEEYERLSQMTSDMLFLAKADNGLIVTRTEIVELAAEVDRLFAFYEALAEERGVRLVAAGNARARVDRDMLRRAISNLLSNAIRHTPRGADIRVTIGRSAAGPIELGVENPAGPIPAEYLPRLFDRFYRVDAARRGSGEGEGAGLGLAIAKSIVEAHGGSISASNPGGLFRISVTIPAD